MFVLLYRKYHGYWEIVLSTEHGTRYWKTMVQFPMPSKSLEITEIYS